MLVHHQIRPPCHLLVSNVHICPNNGLYIFQQCILDSTVLQQIFDIVTEIKLQMINSLPDHRHTASGHQNSSTGDVFKDLLPIKNEEDLNKLEELLKVEENANLFVLI